MDSGILFVSPYPQDAASLSHLLKAVSISLEHASCLEEAASKLQESRFQVVLTEAELKDGTWRDVLNLARQLPERLEVVVTRPWADAVFWAEAISVGAYDLLAQPFEGMEVRRVLRSASARQALKTSEVCA